MTPLERLQGMIRHNLASDARFYDDPNEGYCRCGHSGADHGDVLKGRRCSRCHRPCSWDGLWVRASGR